MAPALRRPKAFRPAVFARSSGRPAPTSHLGPADHPCERDEESALWQLARVEAELLARSLSCPAGPYHEVPLRPENPLTRDRRFLRGNCQSRADGHCNNDDGDDDEEQSRADGSGEEESTTECN